MEPDRIAPPKRDHLDDLLKRVERAAKAAGKGGKVFIVPLHKDQVQALDFLCKRTGEGRETIFQRALGYGFTKLVDQQTDA